MSDALWTAAEAATATGGTTDGDWRATGVAIDSRELQPGDLFVALKDQRDGHDFAPMAFAAGAAAALVERPVAGGPNLIVADALKALEALGLAARDRSRATRAAITGSVGKTSVKEMLMRIFRAAGPAHGSAKSFNNHWGVPLTLARMPAAAARAIFEIGMNTPGEIAPRSRMVRPQVAMITRIAPAHLEGLGSVEAIADEKSDIFAGLEAGGAALLPAHDAWFARLEANARRLQPALELFTFGGAPGPRNASPVDYALEGTGARVAVEIAGERVAVRLEAVGEHWAMNVALALLAAARCGVAPAQAAEALSGYAPPPGRGVAETLELPQGPLLFVDDSYNANPESMRAALAGFAARPGRKLLALGEMRELGPDAAALHAALATPVLATGAAHVFLVGDGMRALADLFAGSREPGVSWASSVEEMLPALFAEIKPGDALLSKGSNASGMHRVGLALRALSRADGKSQKASGASDVV